MLQPELYLMTSYEAIPKLLIYVTEGKEKKKKKEEMVPSWMGQEFGGEKIQVYVWLSPSAVHLKLSQHC